MIISIVCAGGAFPWPKFLNRGPCWNGSVIPFQVGVLQFPIPAARRCYNSGKALRKTIESYPEDLSVAVVSTGGLSHQVHGERGGFLNPEWDEQLMDLLENDPETLANMTHAESTCTGLVEHFFLYGLFIRALLSRETYQQLPGPDQQVGRGQVDHCKWQQRNQRCTCNG